ncbi:MAG: metallophosphoesterase [Myxococcaceae bacterium]|nr:metallophosphoesterase [Myxococcaceae bacterium]
MTPDDLKRRDFLKASSGLLGASVLPVSLVELAGATPAESFTFAYISDSHIQHVKGAQFVRNWDRGLMRAVAECNLMNPRPDFVMFGGDLAQLALPQELDHGAQLLSGLKGPVRMVMGEHDYYADDGAYWSKLFGPQWYSFDHKGVHFVVLNSILTDKAWYDRWPDGKARMAEMAGLDNPNGSPFQVGAEQRAWLKKDLANVSKDTPIVVFSHSPLQKIFKNWNFWTDDAELVQDILKPFKKVNVLYGHVHQIQYNQIGNISFNSVMATAWPWPYPQSYAQAPSLLPKLTVPINRADPFFERDATGWQYIDVASGRVAAHYLLPENPVRTVAFDAKKNQPVDLQYQDEKSRTLPQNHY